MIKNYGTEDRHQLPRILICGASGSGKTNILLNLLYDVLDFDRLYLCAKDLEESKYQQLRQHYALYDGVTEKDIKKLKIQREHKTLLLDDYKRNKKDFIFYCSSQADMIDVNEIDPNHKNVVVFDDCLCDKEQSKIVEYFIRGRKRNAIVIYLAQSFYACPITIRRNCNAFIFINVQRRDREE